LAELEKQARDELALYSADASIAMEHWLELRAGDSETSLSVRLRPHTKVLSAFSPCIEAAWILLQQRAA